MDVVFAHFHAFSSVSEVNLERETMKFHLIVLILISIFKHGHTLQFGDSFSPETNLTHRELSNFLGVFSRENFPTFLKNLSMEQLSEKCLQHTEAFQQGLTSITDGFWQLKSKLKLIQLTVLFELKGNSKI